jgi:hypothetical protein
MAMFLNQENHQGVHSLKQESIVSFFPGRHVAEVLACEAEIRFWILYIQNFSPFFSAKVVLPSGKLT